MSSFVRFERHQRTMTLASAVATFLTQHDLSRSSRRVYTNSLRGLKDGLGADVPLATLDEPRTAEWVFWQTGAALMLPRLLAGRSSGPVFLADRRPTRPVPNVDRCPVTGRARLSYRRAAELYSQANPDLTLHQLRPSALTHAGED